MRRLLALLAALTMLAVVPVTAWAADGRVVSATVDGMDVHVVLPTGYAADDRRYPVLYLLHGFNEDRDAWLESSDLLEFTAERDVIVVLPSAGNSTGMIVDGRDGSCRGETQLMRGVIPYVDQHYRTLAGRAHRAIAGSSAGAFSALHLAAWHPDAFVAAGSLSGPGDITLGASPAGELYFFGAERAAVAECGGDPVTGGLFGTPLADEVWVHNANPADLAPNFGGISVYVGDGNGVPCDAEDLAELHRAGFTPVTRRSSESFVAALDDAGVPNTADFPDCGLHGWRYFEQFLHAFWPQLEQSFGQPSPQQFDYRRADPAFGVWGSSFRADPARAAEFLDVQDASANGVTLTGSGRQQFSTAPYFSPGQSVQVDDGASTRHVAADADGRLTVTVDLGPAHQTQQYTSPVPEPFVTRTVRFQTVQQPVEFAATQQPLGAEQQALGFEPARGFPASTFSSGLGAGAVAAADFDRDGRRDLVVSNCGGGGPSVLRNRGRGEFAPPSVIPTDLDACTVGAGDFDRDGNPDLVAGSYGSGNVTVLLGRGDGTFSRSWQGRSGNSPMQVAIADFNRDGRRDIASMNNSPGTITMLLGKGDGTFRALPELPAATQAISLVSGDFDRDGIPDLAVTDVLPDQTLGLLPGELEVLLGRGDGTFRPKTTYSVGGSPEYVDAGDLDHDGRLDLVVGNAIFNNDISVLYGQPGGKFAPEQRISAPGMGIVRAGPAGADGDPGIQVADFDRDGHLDISVIQTVTSKVIVLRGDGRRHFTKAGEYPVALLPESFLATDLTGDGFADLAVPGNAPALNGTSGLLATSVAVLVNRGR